MPECQRSSLTDTSAEQIAQFQEWFDSVLAGNTGARSRLVWGPSGTKYQPFKEAPYKDEFDEWLARIVCYAFSLPSTAFTKQVNRATAETVQEAAMAEGLAPLMGWVKRLCDHVIQDRFGAHDLEFAWLDLRPEDPDQQSKILDLYVRSGIYAVNEARQVLGLDPVPGGDRPMVYGSQGPVPLGPAPSPTEKTLSPAGGEGMVRGQPRSLAFELAGVTSASPFAKSGFDPDQPRVPPGSPDGGQWTGDGAAEEQPMQVAAAGDLKCQGGYCESGGTYGTTAMYSILGRNVCRDCAVKMLGLENEPAAVKTEQLERRLIER